MSNLKEKWLKEMRAGGNSVLEIARDGAPYIIRGVTAGTGDNDVCSKKQLDDAISAIDSRLDDIEDGTITTDNLILETIDEASEGQGVTFLSKIVTPEGAVDSPSLTIGAGFSGFYKISGSEIGVSILTQLIGGWNTEGYFTDFIKEQTNGNGVTVQKSIQTGITAYPGGGQANAIVLQKAYSIISTVRSSGDSVRLDPTYYYTGVVMNVKNNGANKLSVYPFEDGTIDALNINEPYILPPGSSIKFILDGIGFVTF